MEHKIDLTGNNNDLLLYNELGSRHGKNGSHTLNVNQTEDEQNLGSPRSKLLKILDSHDLSRIRDENGIGDMGTWDPLRYIFVDMAIRA